MAKIRTCPICRRPLPDNETAARFRPFCSKRCTDIDLGRWLNGTYAIPSTDNTDSDALSDEDEEHGPGDQSPRH